MKRKIYYAVSYHADAQARKNATVGIMMLLAIPRSILYVFLRKNMGERFFSPFNSMIIGLLLWFGYNWMADAYNWHGYIRFSFYIFLAAYAIMSFIRYLEIRREPSVFDFSRFSYDHGKHYPFFNKIRIFGREPSRRTIEIYFEPLFCLLIGLLIFMLLQSPVGLLVMFCAICSFLHNSMAAGLSDHFVMDLIDEMICNEELSQTFIKDDEVSPRGIHFFGRKPSNKELRRELTRKFRKKKDDDDKDEDDDDNDDDNDAVPVS